MKGHPPIFSHSADPLQADDWLRVVERQLDTAQCNDQERTGGNPIDSRIENASLGFSSVRGSRVTMCLRA
ncbi:hypothetical protein U9M48_004009 [Paspalum notatum var. saurae]|uniref:Uncharacterized protein n=1 Tax=Paspalum notatum var. saurae TaxID=547442 RepID=A0AAQ3PTU8_PASNO